MSHRLLKHAKAPEAMMTASLPQTCLVLDASGARRLNQKTSAAMQVPKGHAERWRGGLWFHI